MGLFVNCFFCFFDLFLGRGMDGLGIVLGLDFWYAPLPIHFYRGPDICRFVVSPNLSKKQEGEKNE